jgi:predicted DCC family thiol-disulfide oxidoreductase YuxK
VRRLLREFAGYFSGLGDALRRGWNRFFFSAADPTSLGLIRAAVGLLAFWSLIVFGLDLHDYFGRTGWAEPGAIQEINRPLAWSFWFLVPDGWLRAVWFLCLITLALFTLGLFSRVTAVLSWVIIVSTVRRVPIALYGFDQIVSALAFYLAVTCASGQAVSLDRFWRRWRGARRGLARRPDPAGADRIGNPIESGAPRPSISANLALRLIQLHLVVIYGVAGLAKLQGPSWWTGLALWKTMTTGEFVVFDFTALAAWPMLVNLLTHASLTLELLYPVVVWVKAVRPLALLLVFALHLGIAVMSPGLTEFALIMIAANLAFVPGPWLRSLVTGGAAPALRVLYDGACPRCRASIALVAAADPERVFDPIDLTAVPVASIHPSLTREACLRSMHAVDRRNRVTAGFDAVRAISLWAPLFWPLYLVFSVPGLAWPLRLLYNRVAASRPRDVPCTDHACGLPSGTAHNVPRARGTDSKHQRMIATATLADTEEAPRP